MMAGEFVVNLTIECESREQWLAQRTRMVGASESPAILGVGYAGQSRFSVYESKVNPTTEYCERPEFRIGLLMEPVLRSLFTDETGIAVETTSPFTIFRHPEIPFIGATLDGVADDCGEIVPVELKNVSYHARTEWDDGAAPLKYQVQVQHQLACTGASHGYLFGLIGGSDPQVRRIERNDRFITALIEQLGEFWHCVLTRTPPPVDGSEATAAAIARLWPADTGAVVDLPAEAADWATKLAVAKAAIKDAEAAKAEAENRLKAAIKDAAFGRLPDGSGFSWKTQTAKYEARPACEKTFRVLRSVKKIP